LGITIEEYIRQNPPRRYGELVDDQPV